MTLINKLTKYLLIATATFLFYGYLARLVSINFFWEAKSIGWILLIISGISLLSTSVKLKKQNKDKAIGEKIGIGLLIFGLVIKLIFLISIPISDAYASAKDHIKSDPKLKEELGEINGVSFQLLGGIQKTVSSGQTSGTAQLELIIKGSSNYEDVTVFVLKKPDEPNWVIQSVE